VTLDRFVFDPNRGAGNVVVSATRGALRFVSGSQQPSSYTIRTPVATIGVRGTIVDLYIRQQSNGLYTVIAILVEGQATFRIGGQVYNLTRPGQAIVLSQPGGVQIVNWDSTLFAVVGLAAFPLFGSQWPNDPNWTHMPNFPQDRIEQLFGTGAAPAPPPPPDGGGDGGCPPCCQ
jgi:hypothetical protein